ncbi:hypothetical protein CGRA01v4_10926 [Colletotrichum graminicola]|uniref:Uncharacterized protein n=1 Tax=Colletotrichum graminicola (strain M1.001 / M2 / FGSC 10212) TaxID=645133 RepID=E3QKH6_COLGM|nr:uncharacterized protein GLRG_06508 [Colletotrichum graminicola M1.001]EFQ31364.1 hypothetical protein GLRG_06508 [Colletotrichum graminicola M1.001]WDK19639.1 hypothetical protein CGRA01v4_10926 [Colletotrichum graminicola]
MPGSTELLARRVTSVALAIVFFSATSGRFTPVSWFTQSDWVTYIDGPCIADRVLSPVILGGAAILHWYIASQRIALPLTLTIPSGQDIARRGGGGAAAANNTVVLGLWQPSYYWAFGVSEVVLLYAVASGGASVFATRCTIVALVSTVWVLGWNALPWYRKEQAWAMIKEYLLQLIIMEMVNMAFGGGSDRRRRRRRF